MKVETEKKQKPKWLKFAVIGGGVLAVILIIAIVVVCLKPKANIYENLDTFMAQETGNFRYIINVRSEEHSDSNKSSNLEDYMNNVNTSDEDNEDSDGNLQDITSSDEDYVGEDSEESSQDDNRSQTGKLYGDRINSEWGTADGSKVIDWDYPNFEIVINGRTESVEPLKSAVNIRISTEYTSADFCNMVFMDDKCYIDIKTLRDWLLGAEDVNLVNLANSIPDNTVYVELGEDELRFPTPYAELGEELNSGASGIRNYYKRLQVIEKIISSALNASMGDTGITNEDTKCRLSLSGDSAKQLVSAIGGIISDASNEYELYKITLKDNDMITDAEEEQINNEKDNFLSAISNKWAKYNELSYDDIEAMDINVIGKTNSYTSSTGDSVMEVNLGASYTADNIDYIITAYGCKQDLGVSSDIKVEVPKETSVQLSSIGDDYDLEFVKNYLLYYFKIREADNSEQLDVSLDSITNNVLNSFVDLVNKTNADLGGGITKQNIFTIKSYIAKYVNMSEEEASANEVSKANYNLVQSFVGALDAIENIKQADVSSDSSSDGASNVDFKAMCGNTYVYGGISDSETNANMLVLNLKAANLSSAVEELKLSKWYVVDSKGNRYPCNYEVQLKDMDSNFDVSKAHATETLPALDKSTVATYAEGVNADNYIEVAKSMDDETLKKLPAVDIKLYVVTSCTGALKLCSDTQELGAIRQ